MKSRVLDAGFKAICTSEAALRQAPITPAAPPCAGRRETIEAFRPLHHNSVIQPHAGNRGVGVHSKQALHPCSSFVEPPEQATGRRLKAQRRRKLWLLLQHLVATIRSLFIAARHEMRGHETYRADKRESIQRAEPCRPFQMNDRFLGVAEERADQTAGSPCVRRVRIERERPVDERDAIQRSRVWYAAREIAERSCLLNDEQPPVSGYAL
jgi:hypothetical protein